MNWIDSHCHLDALEFDRDRIQVRNVARELGVKSCVIPAVEVANFESVRSLAHQTQDFYTLGIHPLYTPGAKEDDLIVLRQALTLYKDDPRLVGVGEIGLDGWLEHLNWDTQMRFYKEQLKLAREFSLPVILHVRKSADALLKELRQTPVKGGIAHAFTGSLQQAEQFIELGFCIGFGGAISFDRALKLRGLLSALPLSAIVLETDSPDIPPKWIYVQAKERESGRLQGRNDPSQLPLIAQVVAQIKGLSLEELAHWSSNNVRRVLPKIFDNQTGSHGPAVL